MLNSFIIFLYIMFWILSWLAKVALSPLNWIAEVIKDVSWDNWEDSQWASILSMWLSSVVKGTAKWIKKWVDEIME